MLAPLQSIIDKEEHESISSCHYGNMGNSLVIYSVTNILTIDESQCKGKIAITLCFQCCLTFYRMFYGKQ